MHKAIQDLQHRWASNRMLKTWTTTWMLSGTNISRSRGAQTKITHTRDVFESETGGILKRRKKTFKSMPSSRFVPNYQSCDFFLFLAFLRVWLHLLVFPFSPARTRFISSERAEAHAIMRRKEWWDFQKACYILPGTIWYEFLARGGLYRCRGVPHCVKRKK